MPDLSPTEGSKRVRERLYDLLPAIYRIEDAEHNDQLRALLTVIETELAAIERDIEDLYENWFIETCEDWVIPYIGDLLGVRLIHTVESAGIYSLRPYVANTLAYRRRKGTAFVLEELARDLTGWPARAVEFFQLLGTTQHVNHVRPEPLCPIDLRDPDPLDLLYGPFERAAHSVDVRTPTPLHPDPRSSGGRYNIPNVGLFLWRLYPYEVERATARRVEAAGDGCYTFHPLGYDTPLFNLPRTETEITHLAEEINAPGPLRRRALHDELEAWRQALVDDNAPFSGDGSDFSPVIFGDKPVFEIFVEGEEDPIPPERILICNLRTWARPANTRTYSPSDDPHCVKTPDCGIRREITVAVDPELGRIAFPPDAEPEGVEVTNVYAFSSDVGGGPYDRTASVAAWYEQRKPWTRGEKLWQLGVTRDAKTLAEAPDPRQLVQTLGDAVAAWEAHVADHPETFGVIVVMDSRTYEGDLVGRHAIRIPSGSRLAVVAAKWPTTRRSSDDRTGMAGPLERVAGRFAPDDVRPHLLGDIHVESPADSDGLAPGELILDGLLIEGQVTVLPGDLGSLRISHCTLVPEKGGLTVDAEPEAGMKHDRLTVTMERSICGAITMSDKVPALQLTDCIVDGPSEGIKAAGSNLLIRTSTIFGSTTARSIDASDSLFGRAIDVGRRQRGCIRFSYVPRESQTPRRYRCQPDTALAALAEDKGYETVDELSEAEKALIHARLTPRFTSSHYGDPAYAQLGPGCAIEIRTGAEEGTEMGVFNHLQQPQREANLRAALEEYLRFGLEAGLFYVT